MMGLDVKLTKQDNSTNINVTKGASQKSINDTLAATKAYRDEAEAFKIASNASATNADVSAINAASSATSSANSATSASSSASTAIAQALTATTKASEASISASNANASAISASNSEAIVTTKAAEVAINADNVNTMKLAIETIYDTFDDRFLGTFIIDPTLDNDGEALASGSLYFNTATTEMKVYDAPTSAWYSLSMNYNEIKNWLNQLVAGYVGDGKSFKSTQTACSLFAGLGETEIFTGSSFASQGLAYLNGKVYVKQKVSGTSGYNDELSRIIEYTYSDVEGYVYNNSFTSELPIGHQGLGVYDNGTDIIAISGYRTALADNGTKDYGKGYRSINLTTEAITEYQLFGHSTSSHKYKDYYGATPTCTQNGKYIVISALNSTVSSTNFIFVYDRAEVENASNSLDVEPISVFSVRVPAAESMPLQDLAVNEKYIYMYYGYYNAINNHTIRVYDFNGMLVNEFKERHLLDTLGLDDNTYIYQSFEPEGIALDNNNELLLLCMKNKIQNEHIVTFDGNNYACIADHINKSPLLQNYWVKTDFPATSGLWSGSIAYNNGSYRLKDKVIVKVKYDSDGTPINTSINFNNASVPLASSTVDMAYQFGDYFQLKAYNEQTNTYFNAFQISTSGRGTKYKFYDNKELADNNSPFTIDVINNATSQVSYIRQNELQANGAGINMYGGGDTTRPNELHLMSGGASGGIALKVKEDKTVEFTNGVTVAGEVTATSFSGSMNFNSITSTPTTLSGYGIVDAYTETEVDTLLDEKVTKVASTDNAIARFDGTTGDVQNSGVVIDDDGNLKLTNANGKITTITNNDGSTSDIQVSYFLTVDELANATGSAGSIAIVSDLDRGGNFKWVSTGVHDSGVIFSGSTGYWERQYDDAVNVKWFGAKGDGVTDNFDFIQSALNNYKSVFIPAGIYIISQELKLNNNNSIFGEGDLSVLKLSNSAAQDQNVITTKGNTRVESTTTFTDNVVVKDLCVDGNKDRFTSWGGIDSTSGCGVGLVAARFSLVENVFAKNNVKHGIDIAGAIYSSVDAETYSGMKSYNVLIKNCRATNFGDDGITTHHSYSITIENPFIYSSGDFYTVGNSNGVEIDDGSTDVVVIGGKALNCCRGIQIKAHEYSPAATNVRVFGFTAENCQQSFALRHDGHDASGEPDSTTAFNVELVGCTSIVPRQKGDSTLEIRSLNIQGYKNVSVTDFTVIGLNDISSKISSSAATATENSIAIFGNARNILLKGLRVKGFTESTDTIIQINSSSSYITIEDASFIDCNYATPIKVDSGTIGVMIDGVYANTTDTTSGTTVIQFTNSPSGLDYTIKNVKQAGYENYYILNAVEYTNGVDICNLNNLTTQKNIGIGTQNPLRALHLSSSGDDNSSWIRFENTDSVISPGEYYGGLEFYGNDTSINASGVRASIASRTNGNTGQGIIVFSTAPSGGTLTERLTIYSGGDVCATANTQNLGTSGFRWDTLFAVNATNVSSDDRIKEYYDITDVEKQVALELKANMRKFKLLDAIARKGDNARYHFGTSAQTVKSIFEKYGLDGFEYGLLCYDEWYEVDGKVIDGDEIPEDAVKKDLYSIRYEELLCFIIGAM